ncbi:UDP-glucose--hexose-1-phosphate uridylyltransferase [Vagococcus bubulae]|uniref:Galactose-1-phosphate uridylyltransferase n=1 Tax=Vagococcus bubulae TaxID=1977868 RepID=A0A429Z9V6_9ENTE|nr:UDP-glucose--hexose-1-phosphate uridylyltransferase [Vagococcus bubulae]RST90497.1 UDP-glucose--hexose-1-phosphate uridylyltransferase [Vagococcus bubulae]
MMVNQWMTTFVSYAISTGLWDEMDRVYLTNKVMFLIGVDDYEKEAELIDKLAVEMVNELVNVAIQQGKIVDTAHEKDVLVGELMDIVTPTPKQVNDTFNSYYDKSPKQATDYFYQLSRDNDYIKTQAIAKNIEFPYECDYGTLNITINLSKPEKDPKEIKQAATMASTNYPKCMLCIENEGFSGRIGYPNRFNHRVIRFSLCGEPWAFQYSPYAYYNEHSILFSQVHRPMSINKETFTRLVNVLDVFPHYFVGSNADLPIVGGSILSHDHYQAGRCHFPIETSPIEKSYDILNFPNVSVGIVKWPMSVIRLRSDNKDELINVADYILTKWRTYSDEALNISAFSHDKTPHHTVTPIARKKEGKYEMDLVLRDNNISDTYPDGIFHPHPEYHHIKKENIGLIEVMGLAILPPRLKEEMSEVRQFLLGKKHQMKDYHMSWATSIKENQQITEETVDKQIEDAIGEVFLHVLEDAGVYKRNKEGQEGFNRFMETL